MKGKFLMLGKIFGYLSTFSLICAVITGRTAELCNAVLEGASAAVELTLALMGAMCLWTGIAKVLDIAGFTAFLSKLLKPIFRVLYPEASSKGVAIDEISASFGANLLGLGNAALPFGLQAMEALTLKGNGKEISDTASDDMVMFAVLNTVPVQLMPASLIALRVAAGSAAPYEIILPVWICSAATTAFAAILCRQSAKVFR